MFPVPFFSASAVPLKATEPFSVPVIWRASASRSQAHFSIRISRMFTSALSGPWREKSREKSIRPSIPPP